MKLKKCGFYLVKIFKKFKDWFLWERVMHIDISGLCKMKLPIARKILHLITFPLYFFYKTIYVSTNCSTLFTIKIFGHYKLIGVYADSDIIAKYRNELSVGVGNCTVMTNKKIKKIPRNYHIKVAWR